jgi:enoyl-CoA hydratase
MAGDQEPAAPEEGTADPSPTGEGPPPAGAPTLVTYTRQGPVAVLTMDDGRANALGPAMQAALNAALDAAEADAEIGAVVIAGRPGRFSGGFDLDLIDSGDTEAVKAMVRGGGDLIRRAYGGPLPVVAACTGHAVAAGALLLLGCDERIGPDNEPGGGSARIGLNEVAIGLTLPPWAIAIARERLSPRLLQRSVANGRLLDGPRAVDAGFLDAVVPADAVVDRAVEEAHRLAALDRAAYTKTVGQLRGPVLAAMAGR